MFIDRLWISFTLRLSILVLPLAVKGRIFVLPITFFKYIYQNTKLSKIVHKIFTKANTIIIIVSLFLRFYTMKLNNYYLLLILKICNIFNLKIYKNKSVLIFNSNIFMESSFNHVIKRIFYKT